MIVDSTVATPALMRPLSLGADIVVHSLSKCIAASGLAIAGVVVSRQNIISEVVPDDMRMDFASTCKLQTFRDHGPALSPLSALLILSDLRTLRHRIDQFSRSALSVAQFLHDHPAVEQVVYPGLPGFSSHDLARKLLWLVDGDDEGAPANRYGHLLSFTTVGGSAAARRTLDALRLIWHGTDLGRVKSVATIPAISTHQQQGDAGRALASIPDNLIRLSVGGEDPKDLIDDLQQAIAWSR
jgi:cystathionine beta-lyase/cystathionine gamma-synthase